MRSRANLDWCCTPSRKGDAGRCIGWNHNHDLNLSGLYLPRNLGQTVGCEVPGRGVREIAAWMWSDVEVTIPRLGGCKSSYGTVQPVGDGPQRIMVERGHITGIDRTIRAQTVPALPDGGGPHRHRIEPRWAAALREQVIGRIVLPNATQSITDQRRSHKAGTDVVPTVAHKGGQPHSCMPTLPGVAEQAELQGQSV